MKMRASRRLLDPLELPFTEQEIRISRPIVAGTEIVIFLVPRVRGMVRPTAPLRVCRSAGG